MTLTASTFRRRSRSLLVLLLVPLLGGCGGILSSPPERELYRLSPNFSFPPGARPVAAQLLVAAPTAPAGLDTRRIALSRSPETLEYYAAGEWTDRAPFLVQDALVDGFQQSGAVPRVGADRGGLKADFVLDTSVDDFAAAYDSAEAAPVVRVALDARLVRMPERVIVAHHAVKGEQRAAGTTLPEVVRAFDGALGGAVRDLVLWTVAYPDLSSKAGSAR